MNRRAAVAVAILTTLVVLPGVTGYQAPGAGAKAPTGVARTLWGDPDLQGIWTNMQEARTPFERPAELANRGITNPRDQQVLREQLAQDNTPEARQKYEAQIDEAGGRGTGAGPVHWYESLESRRSRLWSVVDPPDGRIPPMTPEAQKRAAERAAARRDVGTDEPRPGGWVEDLSTMVRCTTRGMPGVYIPGAYNNNFQIVQTPGYVAISYEWMHETRVIPLDRRPTLPDQILQWLGSSRGPRGRNTLGGVTTPFTDKTSFRGSTERLRLTERFTRVSPDTIEWSATVEDPTTWTRPWTFEIPLTLDRTQEWVFEYACHEGNYGIRNILSGARAKEKAQADAKQK